MLRIGSVALLIMLSSKSIAQDGIILNSDYNESVKLYNSGLKILSARENLDLAIQNFSQSILLNPYNSDAYFARSQAYYYLNEIDHAKVDILKAIEMEAGQSDYHNFAGSIFYKRKQYKRALEHFNIAIENNETSKVQINLSIAHYNLGSIHLTTAKYYEAIAEFSKAIEQDSTLVVAYHFRGVAGMRSGDSEKGCKDFVKAVDMGSERSIKYVFEYCDQ